MFQIVLSQLKYFVTALEGRRSGPVWMTFCCLKLAREQHTEHIGALGPVSSGSADSGLRIHLNADVVVDGRLVGGGMMAVRWPAAAWDNL